MPSGVSVRLYSTCSSVKVEKVVKMCLRDAEGDILSSRASLPVEMALNMVVDVVGWVYRYQRHGERYD